MWAIAHATRERCIHTGVLRVPVQHYECQSSITSASVALRVSAHHCECQRSIASASAALRVPVRHYKHTHKISLPQASAQLARAAEADAATLHLVCHNTLYIYMGRENGRRFYQTKWKHLHKSQFCKTYCKQHLLALRLCSLTEIFICMCHTLKSGHALTL